MARAFGSSIGYTINILLTDFVNAWRHQPLRFSCFVRFVLCVYLLSIVIHLTACGWIYIRQLLPEHNPESAYLKAVNWAATSLATVGYGDIVPAMTVKMMYAIVVMLLGFVMFGYLIGNIASMMNETDPVRGRHTRLLDEVSAFVREHDVSADLKHRIVDCLVYMYQKRVAFDESALKRILPYGLKTEVSLHLKQDILERVSFFKTASYHFLREVSNSMRPLVVKPGDEMSHVGDKARHMYFVAKGALEVVNENDVVIRLR